jgi:hypothetical protein
VNATFLGLSALTPRLGSRLLASGGNGIAVWDCDELLWIAATFLAGAALGIAWDAHVQFRVLLDIPRPDELDMPAVWERRSHRWRDIGLVVFGVSILFFVAWVAASTVC